MTKNQEEVGSAPFEWTAPTKKVLEPFAHQVSRRRFLTKEETLDQTRNQSNVWLGGGGGRCFICQYKSGDGNKSNCVSGFSLDTSLIPLLFF